MKSKILTVALIFSMGWGDFSWAVFPPDNSSLVPDNRRLDWTSVGVPGGIPNRTTIFKSVKAAPANPQSTTGSISVGTNQLTVASVGDFQVGHGIKVVNATFAPWTTTPADLLTSITAINGNTLTLHANADRTVSGAAVTHDDTAAIQDAINDCPANQVVYLPAGTYLVTSTIHVGPDKDNITVRGAGIGNTNIDCRPGRCFEIGSESDYQWNNPSTGNSITAGLNKGSTQITIGDTSAFSVGQLVQVSVANDYTLPVVATQTFLDIRRQKSRITGKTGSTLSIFPPIYGNFTGLAARVNGAGYQTDFSGFEDMTIDGTNGTPSFVFFFDQTYACWVKNVKIRHAYNYSIYFVDSLNCELRHSYLDELNHSGSNGAGLLMGGSCGCLIEDNIIYKSFPHIEINGGSSGNVFAYNFAEQNDVFGIMGASIDSNHAPHNAYNLFEGNVASVFESDGYFGSDSEETIYRNWFHATCDTTDQFGRGVQINRFSRNFSIIGNILGRSGYTFIYDNANNGGSYNNRYAYLLGLPNIGNEGFNGQFAQLSQGHPWADWNAILNSAPGQGPGSGCCQEIDLDVAATTIIKGNWNAADGAVRAAESLSGQALPNSLYLPSKPLWFGTLAWPPFDPGSPNQNYDAIPAGYRYVHGTDPAGSVQMTPPIINSQPQSISVVVNTVPIFNVGVSGTAPFTYQWKKNGTDISGATGNSYSAPAAVLTDNSATFACVISNAAGTVTSDTATLTVTTQPVPPTITTQPQNQSLQPGQFATFSIKVQGTFPLTYQWRRDGTNLNGAASADYTTPAVTPADNGSKFSCVITNSGGSVTSNDATLTVTESVLTATGSSDAVFLPFKNVFNPTKERLTIKYTSGISGIIFTIYDRDGNKIKELNAGQAGQIDWDGRNSQGTTVASGTYVLLLKQGGKTVKKKILVVK